MYFIGYVLKTGLSVGNLPDVKEIMLYNGRKILARGGESFFIQESIKPGMLVVFYCGHNGCDVVDLENDQPEGSVYRISNDWSAKVKDDEITRTFFLGAKILDTPSSLGGKLRRFTRKLKTFFQRSRQVSIPVVR